MSNKTLNILLLIGGAGLLYYYYKKNQAPLNIDAQKLNLLNQAFPYGGPAQNVPTLADYKIKIGTIKKSLTQHTI